MIYILFLLGFVLLMKGADWLITGASSIARKFNVSEMFIGLTIVSVGTSAPELIVNVLASIAGNSEIAVGNVFGSNIANVLLILGIMAIISPVPIRKSTIRTDIPFVLVATLLVGFLANARLFSQYGYHQGADLIITRLDGVLLLLCFALFLSYALKMKSESSAACQQMPDEKETPKISLSKSLVLIFAGVVFLFFGGKWIVDGAVAIATLLGLSQGFVGLTVVAVGTSIPELVTSVMAARRKNVDMAVGNIVGSNIFNLLWVIGVSALINPLKFHEVNNLDILVMLFSSALIIVLISLNKRFAMNRVSGILFILFYAAYLTFLVYRG